MQSRGYSTFEKLCKEKHGDIYEYFQDYKNKNTFIKIKCKKHNLIFTQRATRHLNNMQGCPKCKASKSEIIIMNYLNKKSISFEYQKKFKDCKFKQHLSFDFFLPYYNLCIEYDGIQHFKEIDFFGGKERLIQQRNFDNIKNEYCKNKNINLLRIPYTKHIYITEILDSYLFSLLNQISAISTKVLKVA